MKNENKSFHKIEKQLRRERKHQRDKETKVHWPAKAMGLLEERLGEGNPRRLRTPPREKTTLKWQSGLPQGRSQLRRASATGPRWTAPRKRSLLKTPRRLAASARAQERRSAAGAVLFAASSAAAAFLGFESRAFFVRSPAGSRPSRAPGQRGWEGVGGGCWSPPLSCARGGHVGRRGRAPSVGAERRDRRGWGGRVALWRYGTSCPFSHSRVLSGLPSRPANGRRPGPLMPPLGPLVRSLLRPDLGRARRARSPASPRPPLPRSPRPHRAVTRGRSAWARGSAPASLSSPRGLPGRLVSALFSPMFTSILSSVGVSLLAPWL